MNIDTSAFPSNSFKTKAEEAKKRRLKNLSALDPDYWRGHPSIFDPRYYDQEINKKGQNGRSN